MEYSNLVTVFKDENSEQLPKKHFNLNVKIIFFVFGLLGLGGLFYLGYTNYFSLSPVNKLLKAPPRQTELKPLKRVLELTFSYDSLARNSLILNDSKIRPGYLPYEEKIEEGYKLEVLDLQQSVLKSDYFKFNEGITEIPPDKRNDPSYKILQPDSGTTRIVTTNLPESATSFRVLSPNNEIIFEKNISEVREETVTNEGSILPGGNEDKKSLFDNLVKEASAQTSDCFSRTPANAFKIIVIGSGYADNNLFNQDFDRFKNRLKNTDPFLGRCSQIYIQGVGGNFNFQCAIVDKDLNCNGAAAEDEIRRRQIPYDKIMVVANISEFGGRTPEVGGKIAYVYNGAGSAHTFVHEIGHLLGLYDEYDYLRRALVVDYKIDRNCFRGDPGSRIVWPDTIPSDYRRGCNGNNWYRSTEFSIMNNEQRTPGEQFNIVSTKIINDYLDKAVGPYQPVQRPNLKEVVWLSPSQLAIIGEGINITDPNKKIDYIVQSGNIYSFYSVDINWSQRQIIVPASFIPQGYETVRIVVHEGDVFQVCYHYLGNTQQWGCSRILVPKPDPARFVNTSPTPSPSSPTLSPSPNCPLPPNPPILESITWNDQTSVAINGQNFGNECRKNIDTIWYRDSETRDIPIDGLTSIKEWREDKIILKSAIYNKDNYLTHTNIKPGGELLVCREREKDCTQYYKIPPLPSPSDNPNANISQPAMAPSMSPTLATSSCEDECYSDELRIGVGRDSSGQCNSSVLVNNIYECKAASDLNRTQSCKGKNYQCIKASTGEYYWSEKVGGIWEDVNLRGQSAEKEIISAKLTFTNGEVKTVTKDLAEISLPIDDKSKEQDIFIRFEYVYADNTTSSPNTLIIKYRPKDAGKKVSGCSFTCANSNGIRPEGGAACTKYVGGDGDRYCKDEYSKNNNVDAWYCWDECPKGSVSSPIDKIPEKDLGKNAFTPPSERCLGSCANSDGLIPGTSNKCSNYLSSNKQDAYCKNEYSKQNNVDAWYCWSGCSQTPATFVPESKKEASVTQCPGTCGNSLGITAEPNPKKCSKWLGDNYTQSCKDYSKENNIDAWYCWDSTSCI